MNTAQAKKVCIIVPAYNEESSLAEVVQSIHRYYPMADVVVVNDASTDNTKEVASSLNVPVLDLPINLGIGGAMQTGFIYAVRKGYDMAMQVDGDGQHDPRFIPEIIDLLEKNQADIVIGSRFLKRVGYTSSFMRLFGIRLFAYLIGLVTDKRIYDSTSGFRAYNRSALEFAARHYPSDFPEPESIVTFLRNGFRIREVSVAMRPRTTGISSVRPFKAAYFVVSNAIAIVLSGFKEKVR